MNISSKVNTLDGLMRSVTIKVDKAEYINIFNQDLNKYKQTLKIDGFRAGKVPENIILKNYQQKIHIDSVNQIIESSLKEVLINNKLDNASPPELSIEKNPSFSDDLIFTAKFEIFPLFSVKNISEISIEEPNVDLNNEEVDTVIANIQKQHIKWEENTDISKSGNKVVLDYEGLIEGKSFENNQQKDFTFIIDDTVKGDSATVSLFNEFYKNTVNEKKGSEKEFQYDMPKDFPDKNIAGKKITYKIKIKNIFSGIIPELNEEFFKKFGPDNTSIKIFKDNVKKFMKVELDQKINAIKTAAINQALLDNNDFDIPKYMHKSEIQNISSQYEGMNQKIDDKIQIELNQIAAKRVKLNLIYMKITEENNLTVSDNDVYNYVSNSDPMSQDQMMKKIKEDQKYLNHIKNKVLEDVIIKMIQDKCKIIKVDKKFSEVVN
tara:strand:- start:339 stop:1643 length:1305 start_codon:yes stop_codon:yes gene_type:complete